MHAVPLTVMFEQHFTRNTKKCASAAFLRRAVHHLFMYELREQQQKKKDLAAVEGEIKTKLCHQLQRFAQVDRIAPDQEMVAQLLPVLLAGMCLVVNRTEHWHRGPETILKHHHRGLGRRETQPASQPVALLTELKVKLVRGCFFLTKPAWLSWLSRLLIRFYLTADCKREAPSVLLLLNPIRQMWRPCKSARDGKIE